MNITNLQQFELKVNLTPFENLMKPNENEYRSF